MQYAETTYLISSLQLLDQLRWRLMPFTPKLLPCQMQYKLLNNLEWAGLSSRLIAAIFIEL
jgi:hypothetical protein